VAERKLGKFKSACHCLPVADRRVVHGLRAILSGRTTNSLLCHSGWIFFNRISVVAQKKMLPRLRTGRQH